MAIIGCDWHARYQPIAMLDFSDGEIVRRRWEHEQGEARAFYAGLPQPSLIGIEATGTPSGSSAGGRSWGTSWGWANAAEIRARAARRRKTEAHDAEHLRDLRLHNRLPRLGYPARRGGTCDNG